MSPFVDGDDTSPFPLERVIVYGDGSPGPYSTGKRFIGGTISLDLPDAATIEIVGWNDVAGTVTFSEPIAAGDSIAVTFAVPPLWIKETYRRQKSETLRSPGLNVSYQSYSEKTPKPFPGLRFAGSKTFDINVGTEREAALNQTLRLNISGNLTEDISLNAVISDQNIPITPEGNTRVLAELDRVLIELKGNNFRVDMGDTDLKSDVGRWLSYTRRLSGARASITAGGIEIFGSGAVSEGRHMSITISPTEGNQGPYRLVAGDGRSDISLVPGTERVWINGERLTRGFNDDYTIDYSTGEIIFTQNRIIGSDMRIVCDYDYTSESYRRTFYSTGVNGTFLNNRISLRTVVAREADDPDRPVLVTLDENMKRALSKSGDTLAMVSGIRPASGDSTGTYDLIDGHLVYNTLKKGEYNVTFSWVGYDSGSYRYRGGGIYEFLPQEERLPGSGASYEPVADLPGPESHTLAGMNISIDPVPSIHIESEVAGSSIDLNTLSGKDDSDNSGGAYHAGISLTPSLRLGVPFKVSIKGNHRFRSMSFSPLDRDRTAEENRSWGLPLVMSMDKEKVTEYGAGLAVDGGRFHGSGVDLSGGKTEFGDSALSTRTGAVSRMVISGRGETNLGFEHIVREQVIGLPDETIDRLIGKAHMNAAGFTPSLVYEGEQAVGQGLNAHGASYSESRTGLKTPALFGLQGGVEWLYRIEQAKHGAWEDSSTVRGGSIELSSGTGKAGMLRTRYARREYIGKTHQGATDQALIEGSFRPPGDILKFDLSYRAGRSRETTKRKNYIYTGGDRGSYRWEDYNGDGIRDEDEFIPDEHGTYFLYEETLDNYKPVNVVNAFGKVGLTIPPWLLWKLTDIAPDITTETSFEINEKSSAPQSDIFLLKLSRFRKQGKTTSGDARFQEDITFPFAQQGSVRLRFFRFNSFEAEYVSGAERRGEEEESLRLRLPLGEEWDTEYTLKHAVYSRTMENSSAGDYLVSSISGDAETSYYPLAVVKIGMNIGMGKDHDSVSGIDAWYSLLKPSFTYHFSGRGRLETSYMLTSVSAGKAGKGTRIPYTMVHGRMVGNNHDISVTCDYRLSNRMNLVASYTGRRFADREFEHFARTQLRAMF